MPTNTLPILYSFRRCPYAIRARMAVFGSAIEVDLHEVSLKDKPAAMLAASSKGTVPVLCLPSQTSDEKTYQVIDESLDIMFWALNINDPNTWLSSYSESDKTFALALIDENDADFKGWLDRYKYADRFPEHSAEYYRQQCELFLSKLEHLLSQNDYLLATEATFADIAIFPFIRQFSIVDKAWFDQCDYPALRAWLNDLLASPLFIRVMEKQKKPIRYV